MKLWIITTVVKVIKRKQKLKKARKYTDQMSKFFFVSLSIILSKKRKCYLKLDYRKLSRYEYYNFGAIING